MDIQILNFRTVFFLSLQVPDNLSMISCQGQVVKLHLKDPEIKPEPDENAIVNECNDQMTFFENGYKMRTFFECKVDKANHGSLKTINQTEKITIEIEG